MQKLTIASSILFSLGFILFSMLPSVSADGLTINSTNYTINKTFGVVSQFVMRFQNTESYDFTNITFESNPYVQIARIPLIQSGQILDTLVNVTTDVAGDYSIRLKGLYLTNVGTSDRTYQINITSYTSNVNPCDFTVIKGDTVIWKNFMQNVINIRNRDTNLILATLATNDSYSLHFDNPQGVPYYLTVGGFGYSYCDLTSIDGSGYVNDPQLDGILNIKVINNFKPTSVSIDIATTDYTARIDGQTEGVLTVRNTGSEIAHNVNLQGDWISFSSNNFTLSSGESKGVIFNIRPIVSDTSQTNKSYQKSISANGNFDSVSRNISVFVPYANVGGNTTSKEDIDYLKNTFCPLYPHSVLCDPEPEIVYRYSANGSDEEFNITVTREQWRDLWLYQFSLGEDVKTNNNFIKEKVDSIESKMVLQENRLGSIENITQETSQRQEDTASGILVTVFVTVGIFVLLILGSIIFYYNRKKKREAKRVWT